MSPTTSAADRAVATYRLEHPFHHGKHAALTLVTGCIWAPAWAWCYYRYRRTLAAIRDRATLTGN